MAKEFEDDKAKQWAPMADDWTGVTKQATRTTEASTVRRQER
jgi:hypothetical protein